MKLKPIAFVRNGITENQEDWSSVRSRLVFKKQYMDGLYRLRHFSHVWIIFGFHKQKGTILRVHPMHDPSKPIVGVFATCSPTRPNKIGLTLVELLSVRGNVVIVKGLDAFDGSPVYDVKPHGPEIDY